MLKHILNLNFLIIKRKIVFIFFLISPLGHANTGSALDAKVDEAIAIFTSEVSGAEVFLSQSAGYLVFPRVIKAGLGIGGEVGEGALRINQESAGYYRTISASFGFQFGVQAKSIIIAFMNEEVLNNFKSSSGWQAGVDASVAIIDPSILAAGKQLNNNNFEDPIVAFIFGAKGLMYNLTLEGTKITKIEKYD